MCETREAAGEFFRAFDADGITREKFLQNFFGVYNGDGVRDNFTIRLHVTQLEFYTFGAIHKPAEFDVIREQ